MDDFDVLQCDATVQHVSKTDDARDVVVLNQTCFYPRGGGQDWDTGIIKADNADFMVDEVRLDEAGNVRHIGTLSGGVLTEGQTVHCLVDEGRRDINSRLHSAGHVIDWAMSDLAPDWVPGRGGHYPHMSFVEYAVPDGAVSDEAFVASVQDRVDRLLQRDYENRTLYISKEEMVDYCRHVPDNIPANKPSRIVLYADDFGIPCGGTHVRKVSDIGHVVISKIKIKQGLGKVSYSVAGIN